jgi:tetratricopeptide (TPR) repeat protein
MCLYLIQVSDWDMLSGHPLKRCSIVTGRSQPESAGSQIREPPRPPSHFFGRKAYVEEMVNLINVCHKSGRGARLVIRGYGGIGKTSVALAVCHHAAVRELFGELRFFVECESTETPALLLQDIASCLGINLSHGDPHTIVMTGLKKICDSRSLLLVLDNAETFLYTSTHSHAKEVDEILSGISAISNITLVLTKRGFETPIAVEWNSIKELDVLSLEAARQIFHSVTGLTFVDLDLIQLDSLLVAVDCVPLAVRLLGQVAQSGNESLDQLHKRWTSHTTDLLRLRGRPDHRETSVSASIEVSLQSKLMKANNHAKRLLSVVSYLPDGLLLAHLEELSREWDADVEDAAHLLKQLSLAHLSSNSHFLTTLSPIREHISRHHSICDRDLNLLRSWHLQLANRGGCQPGDHLFLSVQADLSTNQSNISFLMQRCIDNCLLEDDFLEAVINFSIFLYWSSPNEDLLESVLAHPDSREIASRYRGCLLFELYRILSSKYDYINAKIALHEARVEFEAVGDSLNVINCTQGLGNIFQLQGDYINAQVNYERAISEFGLLGDPLGAAESIFRLAGVLYDRFDYLNSQVNLEKAHSEFKRLGYGLGAARCIQLLGDILYVQSDYVNAQGKYEQALSEFKLLGDRLDAAQCIQGLGDVLYKQSDYLNAQVNIEQALSEFKLLGKRLGAAQCIQRLGDILYKKGDYACAKAFFGKAQAEFVSIGLTAGVNCCEEMLERISQLEHEDCDGNTSLS